MANERFIPLAKRSKKEQHQFYDAQRESWNGVTPVTKVIPNKKKLSRSQEKKQTREAMNIC